MRYLQDKIVVITGAGFSAPANLPVQDKILKEMTEINTQDFLNAQSVKESVKFLIAYIQVSIYLLKEYTNVNVDRYADEYNEIDLKYHSNDRVLKVIEYISINYSVKAEKQNFNLMDALNDAIDKYYLKDSDYYIGLLALKEKLRDQLHLSNIQISLEDVFTMFDKCIARKENTRDYTYEEIDKLQHAILRLFTYYFSNKVTEHDYKKTDYLEMVKYVKNHINHITVITTNWDILLEEYFRCNKVNYDYRFNSSYVLYTDGKLYNQTSGKRNNIPYLKIHGSINWFRCLKCGTLQVHDSNTCGKYLFEDNVQEKCLQCGQIANGDSVQIKPEIITPTMIKDINSQLYNNLWQNAAYALQQADKIIFCGYSLPMADYEFRYMLKQNIQKKTTMDIVLYHNDDPKRCSNSIMLYSFPETRYKDLFPNNNCNFFYEGFGNYFKILNS